MTERRLHTDFAPRPTPRCDADPPGVEIAWATRTYQQHIPSMLVPRQCIADGCGHWPCGLYRKAVVILERAGILAAHREP